MSSCLRPDFNVLLNPVDPSGALGDILLTLSARGGLACELIELTTFVIQATDTEWSPLFEGSADLDRGRAPRTWTVALQLEFLKCLPRCTLDWCFIGCNQIPVALEISTAISGITGPGQSLALGV
jgi:hypothetical protein